MAVAFATAALTLGLSACGNATARSAEPPAPSSAASSTTPTATPEPSYDTTFDAVTPRIAKAATTEFGSAGAEEGTATAIDFHTRYAFNADLFIASRPEHLDQVRTIGRWMTAGARKDWNAALDAYLRGDFEDADSMWSITFYAPYDQPTKDEGKPVAINRDGPPIANPRVVSVKVRPATTTSGRVLQVGIESSADLRLLHGDKPVTLSVDRQVTCWMLRTAAGWKIDGWRGTAKFGDRYVPDRGPR
jgi:hypothetical protein